MAVSVTGKLVVATGPGDVQAFDFQNQVRSGKRSANAVAMALPLHR